MDPWVLITIVVVGVFGLCFLVDKGFDPKFGARSLKRTIQKELEDKAAEQIISNFDKTLTKMYADIVDGELRVTAE